jgi:hypothetical protein
MKTKTPQTIPASWPPQAAEQRLTISADFSNIAPTLKFNP